MAPLLPAIFIIFATCRRRHAIFAVTIAAISAAAITPVYAAAAIIFADAA
jgi:hypothetical protein